MRVRMFLPAAAVLAAIVAAPAAAQQVQVAAGESLAPRPYEPPALEQPKITLGDAVLMSLRHSPAIAQGAERVRAAQGRLQETKGQFDYTLLLSPKGTFTFQEAAPGLIGREQQKRELIRLTRDSFTQLTDGLRKMIAAGSANIPLCPLDVRLSFDSLTAVGGIDFGGLAVNLDLLDPTEKALRGVGRSINNVVINLGDDLDVVDFSNICRAEPLKLFNPDAFVGLWREVTRVIDQSGGRGLEGVLRSVEQIPQEVRILQEQITRTVAERANLALDRLGPLPKDELRRNFTMDASLAKTLRSGINWRAEFQVQAEEHNFVDKPLDPTFGGLDTPPMFFATFGGTVTLPILRGRGAKAIAAQERAAEAQIAGEQEQLRHSASEQVFRTVLAYLGLIGANQRVQALEASRARQAEILQLSQQRVGAGQMAGIELERIRAREASVQSSLAQAQIAQTAARISLADALGVTVASLDTAPLAAEAFATALAEVPDTQKLIDQARSLRRDPRAAEARLRSATFLLESAQTDMRWKFDVTFSAGMSNLYESPFFKYFPDEAKPIIDSRATVVTPPITGTPVPPLSPVHYWNPRGYARLFSGRYEPYATIKFDFELPFGNNTAKGRVAQARATVSQTTIDVANLNRVIGDNIVEVTRTLDRAASALERRESAAADSLRTYDAQRALLQAGNVTLIDVILTEENLANDELQVLLQRQTYLSALARLKFELGELVFFDNPGTASELVRFITTGFVR